MTPKLSNMLKVTWLNFLFNASREKELNSCTFVTSFSLGHYLQMNIYSTSPKGPLNYFLENILTSEMKRHFSENKGM